jgi:hypothetical protein
MLVGRTTSYTVVVQLMGVTKYKNSSSTAKTTCKNQIQLSSVHHGSSVKLPKTNITNQKLCNINFININSRCENSLPQPKGPCCLVIKSLLSSSISFLYFNMSNTPTGHLQSVVGWEIRLIGYNKELIKSTWTMPKTHKKVL